MASWKPRPPPPPAMERLEDEEVDELEGPRVMIWPLSKKSTSLTSSVYRNSRTLYRISGRSSGKSMMRS